MTKLTDECIGTLWTEAIEQFQKHEAGVSVHPSIYLARAIEDAVLERAASVCDETYVEPGDMQVENCHEAAAKIRAMKNKGE
jgi:hypothetical protein